jgi:uncharacterized cupredoxin-like copper-binding protein
MKRWLLAVTLLLVLSLLAAACGGETSGEVPAEAAAEEEPLPVEVPRPAEEVSPAETRAAELAEDAAASEAATKKKNKKAKKKQRRVAVALGEPNEFDLIPAKAKVKAGEVTFKLKNTGSIEHELIVIRTDLDSGELPTDGNGAAAEHGAVAPHGKGHGDGAEHAGAHVGTHVAAGEAGSVTLKLEPGSYALVCNLPGHYASGMHSNFTVTG